MPKYTKTDLERIGVQFNEFTSGPHVIVFGFNDRRRGPMWLCVSAHNRAGFTVSMANHRSDISCRQLAETAKAAGFGFAAIKSLIESTRLGHYFKDDLTRDIVASAINVIRLRMIALEWIAA